MHIREVLIQPMQPQPQHTSHGKKRKEKKRIKEKYDTKLCKIKEQVLTVELPGTSIRD